MNLADEQRRIAALITGRAAEREDEDGYVAEVARSRQLALLREIALWWRSFAVDRYCPLTAAVLKQVGAFEGTVAGFVRSRDSSAFIEEVGGAFLEHVLRGPHDEMVLDVARLESALISVRFGDTAEYELEWSRDPRLILPRLVDGAPIEESAPSGRFLIRVSARLAHFFEVAELVDVPE